MLHIKPVTNDQISTYYHVDSTVAVAIESRSTPIYKNMNNLFTAYCKKYAASRSSRK